MPGETTGHKTGLVITAHPGDFVWRAGGAIALHAKRGCQVKLFRIDAIHEPNKDHIEYQFCR